MKKMIFNLAKGRVIDQRKFWLKTGGILLLTVVLVTIGAHRLADMRQAYWNEDQRLAAYETEMEQMDTRRQQMASEMNAIKTQWQIRVNFCNSLIENKSFSPVRVLDVIEGFLPDGVWVERLDFASEKPVLIQIQVAALSYQSLFEFYKKVSRFHSAIQNESESDGRFLASLTLRIGHDDI